MLGLTAAAVAGLDPVDQFRAGVQGRVVAGAALLPSRNLPTHSDCAKACLEEPRCIAFNWLNQSQCILNGWSQNYSLKESDVGNAYYFRLRQLDNRSVNPVVPYTLQVPGQSVVLLGSTVFSTAFVANLKYLSQFPVDDLLFWFRKRSGSRFPPGKSWGWDCPKKQNGKCASEGGVGLKGSVAGAFLMGTGGALRWPLPQMNNTQQLASLTQTLKARMSQVVMGIKECRQSNGYIMAFEQNQSYMRENPDYVTSWLTHGMLEAATAASSATVSDAALAHTALSLLRGHISWFNMASTTPLFLPPSPGGPTRECFAKNETGHADYLIYQGIIHHTRVALSSVGMMEDVTIAAQRYGEEWWLQQLGDRNLSAVWLRPTSPHNYEVTAIEAYTDLYHITGAPRYIQAVDGFWEMFKSHWMFVGGTVAIKEHKLYPPGSYYIDTTGEDPKMRQPGHQQCLQTCAGDAPGRAMKGEDMEQCWHSTGELCGQAFWVKLNQRLHRLRPQQEQYPSEIEATLLNGVISQIPADGRGIRQFAILHKVKMLADNNSTCCEGQGTRILGSLPEYIYSTAPGALYINMYIASRFQQSALGGGLSVQIDSRWPLDNTVSITLLRGGDGPAGSRDDASKKDANKNRTLALRIPSWTSNATSLRLMPAVGTAAPMTEQMTVPMTFVGQPGSYKAISRVWHVGDRLDFILPTMLSASKYTGFTQIANHTRYAVQYGAVLLAATVRSEDWDPKLDSIYLRVQNPAEPSHWLVPVPGVPLHFSVRGNPHVTYKPYYEVQEDIFEVFPVIDADAA